MKELIVLSLGGSLIVPNKINIKFLESFKKIIIKNKKKFKFVIVCGGGAIARIYIEGLGKEKIKSKKFLQGLLGISATRINARFMNYFFGKDIPEGVPHNMKQIKNLLKKNDFVFCGALRYEENETSDSTSAKLANYFRTIFINLTNVDGLYTKNPLIYKDAKFIKEITWKKDRKSVV